MQRRHALGFFAALLAAPLRAQEIEVIGLRHRSADELLPLLRPFLEPGGALTGQGYQLIVRASAANRAQLKRLLADLDHAPRQLQISVRQDALGEQASSVVGADGSVTVTSGGIHGSAQVQAGNSHTLSTQDTSQTVRVIEGGRAWIAMGTAIPLTFRQYVLGVQGITETLGTVYYEAVTGFHVRPTLAGGEVTLELAPEQSTVTVRGIERGQLATTVRGRLGDWIAVGDADVREDRATSGTLSSERGTERHRRGVWLKVDVLQ